MASGYQENETPSIRACLSKRPRSKFQSQFWAPTEIITSLKQTLTDTTDDQYYPISSLRELMVLYERVFMTDENTTDSKQRYNFLRHHGRESGQKGGVQASWILGHFPKLHKQNFRKGLGAHTSFITISRVFFP